MSLSEIRSTLVEPLAVYYDIELHDSSNAEKAEYIEGLIMGIEDWVKDGEHSDLKEHAQHNTIWGEAEEMTHTARFFTSLGVDVTDLLYDVRDRYVQRAKEDNADYQDMVRDYHDMVGINN